jgi:hypothetical protein
MTASFVLLLSVFGVRAALAYLKEKRKFLNS